MLIDEYLKKDKEYKYQYGKNTFLLFQVGSFFEVYGLIDDITYENIEIYSDICQLAIAKKNVRIKNKTVVMAGFRDYLLDKYIEKIHPHGYTIVVYTQDENNPKIRNEYGIYSPGTTFLDQPQHLSNHMSCIWIQKIKTIHKNQYIFGLSNINLMNGKSNLFEYIENYYHNPTTYDSIETFLNIYNPIEFVLIHNVELDIIQSIIQYLQIKSKKYHVIDLNNKEHILSVQAHRCENQVYQDKIILSFFPQMNVEIFKYDIVDKPIALQSYCFLLNFIHQHNVNLTEKIHEPHVQQINDILLCANHSLQQLNMINYNGDYEKNTKFTSIIGLLNQCKTKMGKRYINELLLNPINDVKKLNHCYSIIEYLLNRDLDFDSELSKISDLEKILTKLKLNKITPSEIYDIVDSHTWMEKIIKKINKKKDKFIIEAFEIFKTQQSFELFVDHIMNIFQLSTCQQINHLNFDKFENVTETLFHKGVNPKLDTFIQSNIEYKDKLNIILKTIEGFFIKKEKNASNYIKNHQPNVNEQFFLITKNRTKLLQKYIDKQLYEKKNNIELQFVSSYSQQKECIHIDLTNIYFKEYNKTTNILCSEDINFYITSIHQNNIHFQEVLMNTYREKIKEIKELYFNHFISFIEMIKQIDVFNNHRRLCQQYKLCKPCIQDETYGFVDAKKMRHLLIEYIETKETYVPNDVCIGKTNEQSGILLYGTNAVGKTSLIKALGINVIMAQCGFYVPCESFTYSPYHYLFTRIIGNDNIFKGLSTFGVEMSELRVILQQCNEKSLILGDELCSGTEIDSALSIFISSLELMSQRKSSFIFATHFHELQQMNEMKQLKNIQCKHLKVQFDYENQQLYYDRRLHDGQGESIYGLEVCKSLKMPDSFIERCYEIRNNYIQNKNNVLLMKTSKYNKDKLKHMCEFCNKEIATETHHLQYQKHANGNDYIDNSFHKNHSANLACVCEKCHNHIHGLHLKFEKRKTMDGNYELILKKN